eukprot:TRINITY_DN8419_c0_g1_i1.p1 TRINITY_DN8419_c0_g1~~TRINITY_DN8419_c0_g1_i1.p1  ORF type:complete len:298 (-),score=39.08 TRINITY_DN8419_c0_g1_i1:80-973(-)
MSESTLLARLTETTLSSLGFFIPNRQMKNIDLDLCRRLVACNILHTAMFIFFFVLIFIVPDFNNFQITLLTLLSAIIFGANPFFIKYAKFRNSVHIIAYISCLELVCLNALFSVGLGGFRSMQELNHQMLPLYAFFMAGALPGVMTTLLAIAEVLYFYYSPHDVPVTVTEQLYRVDINPHNEVRLVNYIISLVLSALIGWVYETTHLRAHRLIDRSLQQVNQLTQSVGHNFDPFPTEQPRPPISGRKRSGSGSDSARTHNTNNQNGELHYSGGRAERARDRDSPPTVGESFRKTHKE